MKMYKKLLLVFTILCYDVLLIFHTKSITTDLVHTRNWYNKSQVIHYKVEQWIKKSDAVFFRGLKRKLVKKTALGTGKIMMLRGLSSPW